MPMNSAIELVGLSLEGLGCKNVTKNVALLLEHTAIRYIFQCVKNQNTVLNS